jgi:hypothetical protein
MSEHGYVEEPILGWLCGEPKAKYGAKSLGWTYRDETAMAATRARSRIRWSRRCWSRPSCASTRR